jgi:hypothetical protein
MIISEICLNFSSMLKFVILVEFLLKHNSLKLTWYSEITSLFGYDDSIRMNTLKPSHKYRKLSPIIWIPDFLSLVVQIETALISHFQRETFKTLNFWPVNKYFLVHFHYSNKLKLNKMFKFTYILRSPDLFHAFKKNNFILYILCVNIYREIF